MNLLGRVGLVAVGVAVLAGGIVVARGQSPVNPISNVTVTMRQYYTPQYNTTPSPPVNNAEKREWNHIECRYQTLPEWMDEVTITFYALVKTQEQRRPYVMFKGEYVYQYVAKGTHIASAYVHPSLLARFGKVEAVAVEIKFNGIVIQQAGSRKDFTVWTKQVPAMENTLLPPSETPFGPTHFYYSEMSKPATR